MDVHIHDRLTTNILNCGSTMGSVANPGKLAVSYTGKQGMKTICSGTRLPCQNNREIYNRDSLNNLTIVWMCTRVTSSGEVI